MINSRHHARCLALEVLYECDIAGHDAMLVLQIVGNRRSQNTKMSPGMTMQSYLQKTDTYAFRHIKIAWTYHQTLRTRTALKSPSLTAIFCVSHFRNAGRCRYTTKSRYQRSGRAIKKHMDRIYSRFVNGVLGSVAEHQPELRFVQN